MSYKTPDVQHQGLRPVGWWSRRHETREAQDRARADYCAKHAPTAPSSLRLDTTEETA